MPAVAERDPVATVDALLSEATARGASDLHLDPDLGRCRVAIRLDGRLEPWRELESEHAEQVVGRLKSLAQLLVYRTDLPQEGCIPSGAIAGLNEVRVATYPARDGERVALRFTNSATIGFDALGLSTEVADELRQVLAQPDGVVLLTGPSGSGKTTTLYASLAVILAQGERRSIVSVEDPIERHVAGVVQTELRPGIGLDGPTALRSLLRQDPDVLMVGEIRDRETAHLVFEAGLTGHLVLSTLHAGTPLQVLARLCGFGIEAFAMGSSLRGILAQRLRPTPQAGRELVVDWLPIGAALRAALTRGATLAELASLAEQDAS